MFKDIISKGHFIPIRIILILIVASWSKLSTYLHLDWSANIIWIVLLPFIIYVRCPGEYSWKYGWATLGVLGLYIFIQAPIFFFFAFCFAVFFTIEVFYGKLNRLAPLVVIIITPLTGYIFNIFGFPIRLLLTDAAAGTLDLLVTNTTAQGNLLSFQGQVFSVDNACMGLRMVIISFLICLLLISYFEKHMQSTFKLRFVVLAFIVTTAVVLLSNFLRIVLLILFKSPPNTLSHELIGLMSLLLIVIIPMYVVVKFLSYKYHTADEYSNNVVSLNNHPNYLLLSVVTGAVLFLGIQNNNYIDMPKDQVIEKMMLAGYRKEILDNNVGKFSNDQALIYIKPSKGFYRSDHSPVACWRGSGYTIQNEQRHEFLGREVYLAKLVADESTLHTAWWYDNGDHQTINQLDWRWRMIKGEKPFQLINITTASQQELIHQITKFLK